MEELFTERFDSCYDCLTSAANLRAICTVFSPLEGLDLSGESNNACRDILDSFLRMLRGLGCSPSEAAADSASLAIFTISVCSKICSCEVKDEFGSNTKFCFFFCVFMEQEGVKVHKHAKNERGQYPATLTKQAWSIKDLLYGIRGNVSCG